MNEFSIAGRIIGRNASPFVIAEMSGNHNHSIERAMEIVDRAAEYGAHAIKLQTYTADTMTIDLQQDEFVISDKHSLWYGENLYELYQKACTPLEWHEPIFNRAKEKGIVAFSSAFDATAVDFLESIDAPAYKIASFEMTDVELVAKVAATGKPVIISTGMATLAEIDETVRIARQNGCRDLVLLRCTSSYPADPAEANLASIPVLRDAFGCQVGISDHTMGLAVPIASVALGATVIEKHFTLARADGGVDSDFSLEPDELRALVRESELAWKALGTPRFGAGDKEKTSLSHRRSLYIVKDVPAGGELTEDNLRSIRPGLGLPVKYRQNLIGRTVKNDVKRGTPMSWSLL
ncbi:pseudaminic acid synthase [Roseibium aggregatum]|uniref:pseudaminic acid synthase n=1 Tax=Roseibium aggregatum TaxID=187304 RepID=UPI00094A9DB6|nr:pseudaminic acid synthase [Roseibium aggregatum]UFI05718.1 pseudaminic acid synthase [Roseibium aggregatum]